MCFSNGAVFIFYQCQDVMLNCRQALASRRLNQTRTCSGLLLMGKALSDDFYISLILTGAVV